MESETKQQTALQRNIQRELEWIRMNAKGQQKKGKVCICISSFHSGAEGHPLEYVVDRKFNPTPLMVCRQGNEHTKNSYRRPANTRRRTN